MNVLDFPLEALAFDYVSFGFFTFVNNLWTWIAVITAAVSFWKIRAAGASAGGLFSVVSPDPCDDRSSTEPPAPPKSDEPPPTSSNVTSPELTPAPAPASASITGHVEDDGVSKGRKVTLYYYEDNGELTEETEEGDGVEEFSGGDGWESYWVRMFETRLGEKSWYRHQDLTELNGNVVRLWDGCCRSGENAVLLQRSKRCVSW